MRTIRIPRPLSCALLCSALFCNSTFAATNAWTQLTSGNASGSWNTAANPPWSLASIPGTGDTADFSTLNITANSTVTLDANQSIDRMIFGDTTTSSAAGWTFSSGSGSNLLTLSGPAHVHVNALGGSSVVGLDVPLTGAAGLTKTGPGTLTLTNQNSALVGNFVISGGILGAAFGDAALGEIPASFVPDNITLDGGVLYNLRNPNFVVSPCNFTNTRGITITGNGGTLRVNNVGFLMNIWGTIASTGGTLTKDGGGLVRVNSTAPLDAMAGKINIAAGTLSYGGAGTSFGADFGTYTPDGVSLNGSALQNIGTSFNNPGFINFVTYTIPGNRGVTIGAAGGTFSVDNVNPPSVQLRLIVNSPVVGTGQVRKLGLATLVLNAANAYSGGTVVSNGPPVTFALPAIQLGNAAGLGSGTLAFSNAASITGLGYTGTSGGGIAANNIILSPVAGLTNRWTVDLDKSVTFSGTVSGHNASSIWVKDDAGTLILTGNNTYSGTNAIVAGKFLGVSGGSCSNANFVLNPLLDSTLGVTITDNTKQWTCNNLEINILANPTLEFNFNVTGSTTLAPLNIRSNVAFNATPFVTINAATLPVSTGNGYPLMTWGGTMSGTPPTSAALLPPGITGTLSVVGNTLYLQITSTYEPLRWAAGNGAWDLSTANWMNSATVPALQAYQEGDVVQFEDTQNPSAGGVVTLDGTVSPSSVLVNSTNDYTITGNVDSVIAGVGPFVKSGPGTLTISGPGGYTLSGSMTVNGGTVIASKPDGTAYGAIGNGNLVLNNGTRVIVTGNNSLAGTSTANAKTITVNSGAVLTNMGTTTCKLNRLILNGGTVAATTANSTFGNWALDFGVSTSGTTNNSLMTGGNIALSQGTSTIFNVGNGDTLTVDSAIDNTPSSGDSGLTKNGNGTLVLTGPDSSRGAFAMNAGTLTMLGQHSGTNAVTLTSGTLRLGSGNVLPSGPMAIATVTISSTDSTPRLITNAITLGTGNSRTTHGDGIGTGKITYTGPVVVLTGTTGRTLTNHVDVEFTGNITGANGPFTNRGAGTLTLSGVNTVAWTGGWNILGGALVVNGAIHSSTPVFLTNGTTLSGTGLVSAPIIVSPGSKILPGTSIGTLTVTNSPSWTGGTVLMELDLANPQTSDRLLRTSGGLTFTGANLVVTNVGPALTNGSSFTLFPAGNTGNFASLNLPPLTGSLSWNTSALASSGTISVVNVSTVPTNITFSVSGGQLELSWPGDHLGWTLQSQTNPITTGITTNWFDVPGTSSATNYSVPLNPLNPTVFYRLRY